MPLGLWQLAGTGRCIANCFQRWVGHGLCDFFYDFDLVRIRDRNALLVERFFDLLGQIEFDVPIIRCFDPITGCDIHRAITNLLFYMCQLLLLTQKEQAGVTQCTYPTSLK